MKMTSPSETGRTALSPPRHGHAKAVLSYAFLLTFALMPSASISLAAGRSSGDDRAEEKAPDWQPGVRQVPQSVLGWSSKVRYKKGEIRLKLRDSHSQPVEQAQVIAVLTYAGKPELLITLKLAEQGKGLYSVAAALPAKGLWTVNLSATKLDREYDAVTTIEVS